MNYLIINTVNEKLNLLLKKDNSIFYFEENSQKKHNEIILKAIDDLLQNNGLELANIDAFGVVVGPGSFTGIRVGIATIKAFNFALKKAQVSINNLELLFQMAKSQNDNINTVAIYGSLDSYFVAKMSNGALYIYDRNLTKNELLNISTSDTLGMYAGEKDGGIVHQSIEFNYDVFCDVFESKLKANEHQTLLPIYYQRSQAEKEKILKSKASIKVASVADLDAIVNVDNICFENEPWNKKNLQEEVENSNRIFMLCQVDEKVIGYINAIKYADEISIIRVCILPEYRNMGFATNLVAELKKLTKSCNVDTLSLEVSSENKKALTLYEKLGFVTRRVRKNYYIDGSDAIEMSLKI